MKPASLTRSVDFHRVHSEGRRARRNGVGVVVYARGDQAPARIGYAIRSSVGSAVTRNRIKRRLRATLGHLELRTGVDVVISGTAEAGEVEFHILVEKVRSGLRAVGAAS